MTISFNHHIGVLMILPSLYYSLITVVALGTGVNTSNYAVQKAKQTITAQHAHMRIIKKGF